MLLCVIHNYSCAHDNDDENWFPAPNLETGSDCDETAPIPLLPLLVRIDAIKSHRRCGMTIRLILAIKRINREV